MSETHKKHRLLEKDTRFVGGGVEPRYLLESKFCVAGGARETGDTPGLVESGDH